MAEDDVTFTYTTRAKLLALGEELSKASIDEVADESRGLVEIIQIAQGFGIDIWGSIIPETDAEADLAVDQLIALLLNLRGDDLPPFDLERYGEVVDELDDADVDGVELNGDGPS